MNKLKLLLLLLIPLSVKATCSNQELARYKALATNVNSYYEYDNNFNVTVYNLSSELKIVNKNDEIIYREPKEIITEIENLDTQSAEIIAKIKELV